MSNDVTAEKIEALGKEIVSLGGEARLRALLRLMEVRMEQDGYKVRCRSAGTWRLSPCVRNPSGKYTTKGMQLSGRVLCSLCCAVQWGGRGGAGDVGAAAPTLPSPRIFACLGPATPNKQSP